LSTKAHHIEIDDGDPNEVFVHVTINAEDNSVIDIIEMYLIERRESAYAMAHRLAKALDLPLTLIDGYGSEPKSVTVGQDRPSGLPPATAKAAQPTEA
jgi:hypothetical protein